MLHVFRVINVITIVTLLESLSLCQQDTAGGTLKTDAQRCAAYPLIDVVQLPKNCSTLRVVPYLWGCFNPASRDYRPTMCIYWLKRAGHFWFSTYDWCLFLTNSIQGNYSNSYNIMFHSTMFSKLESINFNGSWLHPSRKGRR